MATDTATDTITWKGASGRQYEYWILSLGKKMKAEPGNYMFLKRTAPNTYASLYVGQTGDLDDRLSNPKSHHKWECVSSEGATHICAHTNAGGEGNRKTEEADLIAALNPPCNG